MKIRDIYTSALFVAAASLASGCATLKYDPSVHQKKSMVIIALYGPKKPFMVKMENEYGSNEKWLRAPRPTFLAKDLDKPS